MLYLLADNIEVRMSKIWSIIAMIRSFEENESIPESVSLDSQPPKDGFD